MSSSGIQASSTGMLRSIARTTCSVVSSCTLVLNGIPESLKRVIEDTTFPLLESVVVSTWLTSTASFAAIFSEDNSLFSPLTFLFYYISDALNFKDEYSLIKLYSRLRKSRSQEGLKTVIECKLTLLCLGCFSCGWQRDEKGLVSTHVDALRVSYYLLWVCA